MDSMQDHDPRVNVTLADLGRAAFERLFPGPRETLADVLDRPTDPWAESDRWRWELGPDPDPADAAWAAEEFGADADDYTVLDVEREAAESAAADCLGRGLIPNDTAERLARTSLVGHNE
jgi:hypothetical protein